MKCIKSIKPLKNTEVGTINRINDVEAEARVLTGYWQYIPKSEWKAAVKPAKKAEAVATTEESTDLTIAEKQLKRKKSK